MKKFITIVLVAMVFAVSGVNSISAKQEASTEKVTYSLTPAPVCENCVKKIKGNMRFEKGVKDIDVDLKEKNVTITFSSKATNKENLQKALKKIGYSATETPADTTETVVDSQK